MDILLALQFGAKVTGDVYHGSCHLAWILCTDTNTHSYLHLHRAYWITLDQLYSQVNMYIYIYVYLYLYLYLYVYMYVYKYTHTYTQSCTILYDHKHVCTILCHLNPHAASNLAREMLQEKSMPSSSESTSVSRASCVHSETSSELILELS